MAKLINLEEILINFLNNNNEIHNTAEKNLNYLENQPDVLINELFNVFFYIIFNIQVLNTSNNYNVKALSAVALRNYLCKPVKDETSLFYVLPNDFQDAIKTKLLYSLESVRDEKIGIQICETTSEIAYNLLEDWPELIPKIMLFLNHPDPLQKEIGFRLVNCLSPTFAHQGIHLDDLYVFLFLFRIFFTNIQIVVVILVLQNLIVL